MVSAEARAPPLVLEILNWEARRHMERLFSLFGMVVILASPGRSPPIARRSAATVAWGLGLQLVLALFVLKTPIGRTLL